MYFYYCGVHVTYNFGERRKKKKRADRKIILVSFSSSSRQQFVRDPGYIIENPRPAAIPVFVVVVVNLVCFSIDGKITNFNNNRHLVAIIQYSAGLSGLNFRIKICRTLASVNYGFKSMATLHITHHPSLSSPPPTNTHPSPSSKLTLLFPLLKVLKKKPPFPRCFQLLRGRKKEKKNKTRVSMTSSSDPVSHNIMRKILTSRVNVAERTDDNLVKFIKRSSGLKLKALTYVCTLSTL